jgi:ssDNA thymidine ADP-ribosyltransferase, DarT
VRYSQRELDHRGVISHSIANQEVQSLRKRIYIWDFDEKRFRPLHSYVPFYFTPRTPMFRNQRNNGIQNDIVIFEVSRDYIGSGGIVFTDGNASNQQLSKAFGEEVYIVPATTSSGSCHRTYKPKGPYGKNPNRSDFYTDPAFLDRINWDVINGNLFIEDREEYKRLKHAEVLCPDRFPLDEMLNVYVSTVDMLKVVRHLFVEFGHPEHEDLYDLHLVCRPDLFL